MQKAGPSRCQLRGSNLPLFLSTSFLPPTQHIFAILVSTFSHHNLLQLPSLLHPFLHCLRHLHLSTSKTSCHCSRLRMHSPGLFSFQILLRKLLFSSSFDSNFILTKKSHTCLLFYVPRHFSHFIPLYFIPLFSPQRHSSSFFFFSPPPPFFFFKFLTFFQLFFQPQFSTLSHPYTLRLTTFSIFSKLSTTCPLLSTSTSFCSFFPEFIAFHLLPTILSITIFHSFSSVHTSPLQPFPSSPNCSLLVRFFQLQLPAALSFRSASPIFSEL